MMEQVGTDTTTKHQQWFWQQLSPQHLDHRVRLPTAITLHRLVPKTPHPPPASHTPAAVSYKYLKPKEIEEAQLQARHALLEARLAQDAPPAPASGGHQPQAPGPGVTTSLTNGDAVVPQQCDESTGASKTLIKNVNSKPTEQREASKKVKGGAAVPVHRGIGEVNLRIRQVTRLVVQISHSVKELEYIQIQTSSKRDFVSPYDNEIKRKRWEEFLHSAGRTLFSLKREVSVLERKSYQEEKQGSRYLRILAVSTRTIHRLLLALKTHAENVFESAPGKKLFVELVAITQRLFSLAATVGVKPPKLSIQMTKRSVENTREDSSTESSELATSDIDCDALSILHPSYVRDTIATLAHHRLQKKRKKKQNGASRNLLLNGKEETKRHTILHLLKNNKPGVSPSQRRIPVPPASPTRTTGNIARPSVTASSSGPKVSWVKTLRKDHKTRDIVPKKRSEPPSDKGHSSGCSDRPIGRLSPEAFISKGKMTPSRRKQSPEGDVSPGQSSSPVEESSWPPQPDTRYKMISSHQLVEDTAEAVVNRLRVLFKQETKEETNKHRTTAVEEKSQGEQEPKFDAGVSHQIHYLMERLCKIEDKHKKAEEVVSEISQRMESQHHLPDISLGTAIQKAKYVMSTLEGNKPCTVVPDVPRGSSRGLTWSKNTIIPQKQDNSVSGLQLPIKPYTNDYLVTMDEDESMQRFQKQGTLRQLESHWSTAESIESQVKYQKEEFWASMVQRGFIKPHEVTAIGTQDMHQVMEKMLRKHPSPPQMNVQAENIIRENSSDKNSFSVRQGNEKVHKPLATTNARRQRTLVTAQLENKETCVGSSLETSNSSFPNKYVEHRYSGESSVNPTSGQSEAGEEDESGGSSVYSKGVCNLSTDDSISQQSSAASKSGGSLSFPSYEGVSSSD
ncbi:hypothetical protein Hamer_G016313 [Homarus americanus]|uniref:Uncharacterized protein n=1 Tax=Homarus americanus TaxID=6706 RepID=A0A8J5MRZ0_HOMAM|nr:hypothetical protein Hamer_G016313 [Homarus americanus]